MVWDRDLNSTWMCIGNREISLHGGRQCRTTDIQKCSSNPDDATVIRVWEQNRLYVFSYSINHSDGGQSGISVSSCTWKRVDICVPPSVSHCSLQGKRDVLAGFTCLVGWSLSYNGATWLVAGNRPRPKCKKERQKSSLHAVAFPTSKVKSKNLTPCSFKGAEFISLKHVVDPIKGTSIILPLFQGMWFCTTPDARFSSKS